MNKVDMLEVLKKLSVNNMDDIISFTQMYGDYFFNDILNKLSKPTKHFLIKKGFEELPLEDIKNILKEYEDILIQDVESGKRWGFS